MEEAPQHEQQKHVPTIALRQQRLLHEAPALTTPVSCPLVRKRPRCVTGFRVRVRAGGAHCVDVVVRIK